MGEGSRGSVQGPVYVWNPKIACRTLEDTAFILYQSRMVSLNEVGTFIWERFREPARVLEVVDEVLEHFETTREQATSDVDGFVRLLAARDLVIVGGEASPS
ncbi:MAG: PqqD family protein [Myxococcota bacterium]|nr:PqqD family protein [Myxococcota bacterium]